LGKGGTLSSPTLLRIIFNILISIGGKKAKKELLESVRIFYKIGYRLYGTRDTVKYYRNFGIKMKNLFKIQEKKPIF